MRTKSILTNLLFLTPATLLAGSIEGVVNDNAGGIPFADVILYQQSDTIQVFRADVTGEDGTFILDNIPNGHYMLKVEAISMKTKRINLSITNAKPHIKSIKVNMKDDVQMISGAEVVGQRTALHVDADKKTFLVNAGAVVEGVSASDLLREVPSVDVDVEGNVSLRNNEGVEIYINGKPAGISDGNASEILEQLPANSIEKVEVITNPSSKYNAEGSAGIINIVLKEDARQGYYGSANAGLNVPVSGHPSGSLGANITYNTRKWMLSGSLGWQGRDNIGESKRTLEQYNNGDTTISCTDGDNHRKRNSENVNLGATYRINDKNSISWRGMANFAQRDNTSDVDVDNGAENDYKQTEGRRTGLNTTLDYNHEFDKKDETLRIAASANTSRNKNENGYSTTLFDNEFNPIDDSRTFKFETSKTRYSQYTLQADYSLPLTSGKIELGAKGDWSKNQLETENTKFTYKDQAIEGNNNSALEEKGQEPKKENDFEMSQNIYALYATYSNKLGKRLKYNVGLRGELTDMKWEENLNGDESSKDPYFKLFPSAFFGYTISEKDELQLNYTRRLTRPRMRFINPYVNMNDARGCNYGNPDLDPEMTHAVELNYVRNVDGDLYTASVYFKHTDDLISRFTWVDDNDLSNTTFGNMGKCQEEGLELIAKNHIGFLTLTSNVNLYYYSIKGGNHNINVVDINDGHITNKNVHINDESSFSWTGKVSADMNLPWKLTGQVTANYNSPKAAIQGRFHHIFTMNAGLKRSFLERKLNASISVRDLFNTFKLHSTSYGDNFYQDNEFRFSGTTIFLNVSYNFGNMKNNKKKQGGRAEREETEDFSDFGE